MWFWGVTRLSWGFAALPLDLRGWRVKSLWCYKLCSFFTVSIPSVRYMKKGTSTLFLCLTNKTELKMWQEQIKSFKKRRLGSSFALRNQAESVCSCVSERLRIQPETRRFEFSHFDRGQLLFQDFDASLVSKRSDFYSIYTEKKTNQ